MTKNKRIFLNVVATYGRSLIALFCGLFTSRWVLMALGADAYGVYGILGVIVSICVIINSTVSGSIGRFYAFAIGQAEVARNKDAALEDCRGWFNVALLLHLLLPSVLVGGGLAVGLWGLKNYFIIPAQYISTAHDLLFLSLASMFVSMCTAPFSAMYKAKQNITELTLFEILSPIVNICCAWVLLSYKGDRLFFYAFYMAMISIVPNLLIMIRASYVFPECRIRVHLLWNWNKLKQLFSFAGWQAVGLSGVLIRTQGASIIVNRMLGVDFNSTMTVSGTVSNHAGSLSMALNNAFSPAVTSAAGAKDVQAFYNLALRASKFGTLLLALFAIPLAIEIDYIVHTWLKVVPPDLEKMCVIMLINAVIDRCGNGATIAINASGDVKIHEILCAVIHVCTLVLCILFVVLGYGIVGIGIGLLGGTVLLTVMRMILWKWQLALDLKPWLFGFLGPAFIVVVLSVFVGSFPTFFLEPTFWRLLISSTLSVLTFVGLSFIWIFDSAERNVISSRLQSCFTKGNRI